MCDTGDHQSGNNSPAHWVAFSAHKGGTEYLVSGWVKSSFTEKEPTEQFCATVSAYTPAPAPKGKCKIFMVNLHFKKNSQGHILLAHTNKDSFLNGK